MQILKAGINKTGPITLDEFECSVLMIKGNGGVATVTINEKTFAVTSTTTYETFEVNCFSFTVASGNVDYVALG